MEKIYVAAGVAGAALAASTAAPMIGLGMGMLGASPNSDVIQTIGTGVLFTSVVAAAGAVSGIALAYLAKNVVPMVVENPEISLYLFTAGVVATAVKPLFF